MHLINHTDTIICNRLRDIVTSRRWHLYGVTFIGKKSNSGCRMTLWIPLGSSYIGTRYSGCLSLSSFFDFDFPPSSCSSSPNAAFKFTSTASIKCCLIAVSVSSPLASLLMRDVFSLSLGLNLFAGLIIPERRFLGEAIRSNPSSSSSLRFCIPSNIPNNDRLTSGMYLSNRDFRSFTSRNAFRFARWARSWLQQLCRARFTLSWISVMSSPMYSFPVPLNGTLVDTMDTKTPILSFL
mmetsp:Transcript_31821/g.67402  ORF Transcript_31821/g.67402 Transcript_31821/m.67402 type:complete len:238 (-) Transcript_31821:687-1400(-)